MQNDYSFSTFISSYFQFPLNAGMGVRGVLACIIIKLEYLQRVWTGTKYWIQRVPPLTWIHPFLTQKQQISRSLVTADFFLELYISLSRDEADVIDSRLISLARTKCAILLVIADPIIVFHSIPPQYIPLLSDTIDSQYGKQMLSKRWTRRY